MLNYTAFIYSRVIQELAYIGTKKYIFFYMGYSIIFKSIKYYFNIVIGVKTTQVPASSPNSPTSRQT